MVEAAEERIREWLEEAVIGLNLCPFAASFYRADRVRIAVENGPSAEAVIERTLKEARHLLATPAEEVATTLVVCSRALTVFDEFMEAVHTASELLQQAGARGALQLAHFHPRYRFAGSRPEDLGNYTNRSPYPTFHLLREADVTQAVEAHPDPESIPGTNIARLEGLGRERVEELWSAWAVESPR